MSACNVTILTTVGPKLTKVFKADGTVEAYDDAASFKVREHPVASLRELSALLVKLENRPQSSIIRGKFVGKDRGIPAKVPDTWVRQNANFDDQPLPWIVVDVDGFKPKTADPVTDPEAAIHEYIATCLPVGFHGASFHWQLSSSAGTKGKEGLLKAHVWFWLDKPRTSAEMYAWAIAIGTVVDKAVYRRVQHHYTASPIFEEGVSDPVPRRSGFFEGLLEDVSLELTPAMLESVREGGAGQGGQDMELKDPSQKAGLIGAFHRAFTPEQVLLDILEGEFEQVTERRYTWHGGGGTPEGVWVHSDGMHIGSSHNTWPLDGIANLWDVVRVFKFGDLDHAEDEFEQLNIESAPVGARPSDLAMSEWAASQEAVAREAAEADRAESERTARERLEAVKHWREAVNIATDEYDLREVVCRGIREDTRLSDIEIDNLAKMVQKRFKAMNVEQSLPTVKKILTQKITEISEDKEKPDWLHNFVYVTDQDKFYRYDSDEWLTQQSFNARFNRKVRNGDPESPSAYTLALEVFRVPTVTKAIYWPGASKLFEHEGVRVVNLYRPSSVPPVSTKQTKADKAAIEAIRGHVVLICGGREWLAEMLLDWMAHNVQHPGVKIRFAPVIQGVEGDGKSVLGELMAVVMGPANVKIISPKAIATDFNGWAEGSCLGVLEEIRLVGHNRYDILNAVKPCITNNVVPIHRKGRDEYNCPNMTNYLAFTNYKDALPLEDTDRRWWVIFTPWANKEGMAARAGEDLTDYFDRLHNAVANHGPALRTWMLERSISPAFNRHGNAPDTEEKRVMVSLGVSEEETVARHIIEDGCTGVSKDIVSTTDLATAMRDMEGIQAPQGPAMARLMLKLGFSKVERPIKWEGRTRRVWVRGTETSAAVLHKLLDATRRTEFDDGFLD